MDNTLAPFFGSALQYSTRIRQLQMSSPDEQRGSQFFFELHHLFVYDYIIYTTEAYIWDRMKRLIFRGLFSLRSSHVFRILIKFSPISPVKATVLSFSDAGTLISSTRTPQTAPLINSARGLNAGAFARRSPGPPLPAFFPSSMPWR